MPVGKKRLPAGRRITKRRIDPADVIRSVGDDGAGAVVLFLGVVRDSSEAGAVSGMAYEAYEPMAEKLLLEVEEEVRRTWPSTKEVKIVHRVGDSLSVGDVSVAVAVSSPHRAEAFEACRHAIEKIKHGVPIWKKERLADGREAWVKGRRLGSSRQRKERRGSL
ncbi:MAG: molybdenum cofactor biosynthesis protein MoaE [Thaumarchaeota archaeon]|nr:molybdenum cofactor biosynthesis protein MoaE [Nitrososphaerota archaeon]